MANIWGAVQSTITTAYKAANKGIKAGWTEITSTIVDEGETTERRLLDVAASIKDANGKVPGESGYTGPVVQAREPACFVSITAADLTANVYTVTGDPATRLDGLKNKGVGVMTVTLDTGIVLSLDPGDVYNDIDLEPFTTLTFSAGAEFKAMICR